MWILDVGEDDGEVDGDVDREGKGGGNNMVEAIAALDGWRTKSAGNLQSAIRAVAVGSGDGDGVGLLRFIYSLRIRHVGTDSSRLVTGWYGTVDRLLEAVEEAGSRVVL